LANDLADEPIISVSEADWTAFCQALVDGVAVDSPLWVEPLPDGGYRLGADPTVLTFTDGEWQAFLDGLRAGELVHPQLVGARA
jgi:hypothetical protein